MKSVKISLIVPVYKTEKYLERCLNSIINQSLKEIEVIVINDGSPDNCLEIMNNFKEKDNRIKIINKENGGVSSARNSGLKIATGKYILSIDSDDWIEEGYLEDVYLKAEKDNLDIVITDTIWDYENGKIQERKDLELSEDESITGQVLIEKILEGKVFPCVWNKLIKRELHTKHNIFYPEEISMGEDMVVLLKASFVANKIGKLNKAYVHYIQNPNGAMKSNASKKVYELLIAFKILELFIKNKNLNKAKIRGMNALLFGSIYDIKDEFYELAIEEYLLLHKNQYYLCNIKRFSLYSIILNKIPNKNIFYLLYYLNANALKLKLILKKGKIC